MEGMDRLCVAVIERAFRDIGRRNDIKTTTEDSEDALNWIMSEDMGLFSLHYCVDIGCKLLDVETIRNHAQNLYRGKRIPVFQKVTRVQMETPTVHSGDV